MRADENGQLLADAIAGNHRALGNLLIQHVIPLQRALERYAATQWSDKVRSAVYIEDVVQDALSRAIRDIATYDERRGSFANWLMSIGHAALHDARRSATRRKRGGAHHRQHTPAGLDGTSIMRLVDVISADGDTPATAVAKKEALSAIRVGIATLPDTQRNAVRLHEIHGLSLDETAEQLQRSPAAIRGLLYRARASLREFLGQTSRWFGGK